MQYMIGTLYKNQASRYPQLFFLRGEHKKPHTQRGTAHLRSRHRRCRTARVSHLQHQSLGNLPSFIGGVDGHWYTCLAPPMCRPLCPSSSLPFLHCCCCWRRKRWRKNRRRSGKRCKRNRRSWRRRAPPSCNPAAKGGGAGDVGGGGVRKKEGRPVVAS